MNNVKIIYWLNVFWKERFVNMGVLKEYIWMEWIVLIFVFLIYMYLIIYVCKNV